MSAPSAAAFLRKRKDKRPAPSRFPANGGAASSAAGPSNAGPSRAFPIPPQATTPKSASSAAGTPGSSSQHLVEIKLFSAPASALRDSRYNLMKLNHLRDFDPATLPKPILLNRKQPGPRAPPTFALDEEGGIIGKYKYDEEGKPVLGEDGLQVIETKEKADLSLIGGSDQKKVRKKAIKEVYHQEKDVMRLRREEATPWVLETGNPTPEEDQTGSKLPEHWVGRYVDPHSLPTVLFVNDGRSDGFQVIPLGRTYKFEPERPFKVLDPDASHKLFEFQSKTKGYDRWALRGGGGGPNTVQANGASAAAQIKREAGMDMRHEKRALAMEERMMAKSRKADRKPKVERFDDDNKREGRGMRAGLEGGAGEELDYDEKDDFQDDDDVNTFHVDADEEAEQKLIDARLKKEYRIANATVGDRPQIEDELAEERELFGGNDLTQQGKKLRKMIKKRRGSDDMFGDSDEDSDESEEETPDKKAKEKEKEAEKAKAPPPGSAERPSRPPSRGPGTNRSERGATSPGGTTRHLSPTPTKGGKSSTAPPVSGASFIAQRATGRGVSPASRSRGGSPRAGSPDSAPGGSRTPRAGSPATTGRAQSPPTAPAREGTPPGGPRLKLKASSASTSTSPAPSPNPKRKPSPGAGSNDPPRKKKKGSNTPTPAPEDIQPFEGMITKDEMIVWFRSQKSDRVPMGEVINAFRPRLTEPATQELKDLNTKLFMGWVTALTVKGPEKTLQFKAEYQ